MRRKLATRLRGRPGRPVADRERDTRVLLLDAATQLFAEQGVAATSFSTIARRAGLTPAMVHYYFRDREKLIDAVVEERLVPIVTYVWNPVQAGDDPAHILSGVVQRLLEQIQHAPWVPSTWMREILNEDGLLRGRMQRRLPLERVRILGQAIALGQASGNLNRCLNPMLMVFSTLGLVMVHMSTLQAWSQILRQPTPSLDQLQNHIVGLLLHGLDAAPKSTRHPARGSNPPRRKR
jgi:TetR/AcrR family transcriptional regulator